MSLHTEIIRSSTNPLHDIMVQLNSRSSSYLQFVLVQNIASERYRLSYNILVIQEDKRRQLLRREPNPLHRFSPWRGFRSVSICDEAERFKQRSVKVKVVHTKISQFPARSHTVVARIVHTRVGISNPKPQLPTLMTICDDRFLLQLSACDSALPTMSGDEKIYRSA